MVLAKGTAGNFSNTGGTKGSGYVHGMACISMIDSGEISLQDGRIFIEKLVAPPEEKREEAKVALNTCSSSSTSSIGKNSDISGRSKEKFGDADEVQSSYKGPLDAMETLEQVLPMRRGISSFYNGKSKSFACLTDAPSTSSIKELAKPENAYIRKRRNLLASSLVFDNKNRNSPLKSNGGGVSKRVTNSNRSTLALAVTMSSSSGNPNNDSSDNFTSHYPATISGSASWHLRARLHSQLRHYNQPNGSSLPIRRDFSAWRSLSLADLQHCVSANCTSSTPRQFDTNGSST